MFTTIAPGPCRASAAVDAASPAQRLNVLNALSYVHYATGRLAAAVRWQREAIAVARGGAATANGAAA